MPTFIVLCFCFWLYASTLVVVKVASSDSLDVDATATAETLETCVKETCTTNDLDKATTTAKSETQDDEECGVWLALSTLPGTGIGMFAGKSFLQEEMFMAAGDHIVPIIDFYNYQANEDERFLWSEYTWTASVLYVEDLGIDEVKVASPGFGAAANSFMDFVNAEELYSTYSIPHGIHRRSDPGAGAFTYYHSRPTKASVNITPGEELFVTYGDHWFLYRKHRLGPIPIEGDHDLAEAMYRKYRQILERIQNTETTTGNVPPPTRRSQPSDLADDLWDTFVLESPWDTSPTMAALPPKKDDYEDILAQSLIKVKKSRLFRDTEWLQQNGVCADTMHMGESTIRQAGHGAFASRRLRQNAVVLPVPLIHIPYKQVLNMYSLTVEPGKSYKRDIEQPTRPQLLLNYCMGHRDSTLLLSPYGPVFNLINHNQTLANVKLQWASPQRSQHNPDLLNMDIAELGDIRSSQLAMELVALRDIEAGEEIFLDYGDEWEAAWQKHVQEWKPVEGADTYISAFEMNQQSSNHIYRTEFEQMKNPYPPNLMLKFHNYFLDDDERREWIKKYPHHSTMPLNTWMGSNSAKCEILRHRQTANRTLYAIMIPNQDDEGSILEDVPQEAIFFQDRPYSTDMFLENAFRHDLRIPNDIFPEKWRNAISE